jgi:hypothetical protein
MSGIQNKFENRSIAWGLPIGTMKWIINAEATTIQIFMVKAKRHRKNDGALE